MVKPMGRAEWERFKDAAKEYARMSTFEARIEELEAICRDTPGVRPNSPRDAPPEEHSRAWHAREILSAILRVRHNLKQGSASYAAAEALGVGVLASRAAQHWPELEQWLKLDSKSKERVLVGEVTKIVSTAGQICRELTESDQGIDMEIEFKSDLGQATGRKVYLQLKAGDSHLRKRKSDGAEIFDIKQARHVDYWRSQAFPVLLIIRSSYGQIRWMEIRDYLKREDANGRKRPRQIVFIGEPFNFDSVLRLREQIMLS